MKLNGIRKIAISLGIGLLVCMIIGSCFDYQISQALFDPDNTVGVVLASYGQLPAMLSCAIGGALLIRIADKEKKLSKRQIGHNYNRTAPYGIISP